MALFRHEAALLLRALEEHLARQVTASGGFEALLAEEVAHGCTALASVGDLARLHDRYSAALLERCLLPEEVAAAAPQQQQQQQLFAAGERQLMRLLELVRAAASEGMAALAEPTLVPAPELFAGHLQTLRQGVRLLHAGVLRLAAATSGGATAPAHFTELAARLAAQFGAS
jgi:hypothetical protein